MAIIKEKTRKFHDMRLHMIKRCYNPNHPAYSNYGGRGIEVCDEWLNSFKAFRDYVMSLPNAMGSGHTVDRINNNGNYEPGNLRWATWSEQNLNKRSTNKIGHKNIFKHINRGEKFGVKIMLHGKYYKFGYCDTVQGAVGLRNKFCKEHNIPIYD